MLMFLLFFLGFDRQIVFGWTGGRRRINLRGHLQTRGMTFLLNLTELSSLYIARNIKSNSLLVKLEPAKEAASDDN